MKTILYLAKVLIGIVAIAAVPVIVGVAVKLAIKLFLLGFNLV